ncbi:MAG: hypothetical protein HY343_06985 [Lentisphaerae bacterium]|nr:hypothetical protein [Lentisphaerota bacterium]
MIPDPISFEKLLVNLVAGEVAFITVGGLACAMCGFVRTTEDVDIIISREPRNLERLLNVLGRFGEGHARELTVSDFADEEGAIRVIEEFPLDIFVRMQGHTYTDLLPYRSEHRIGETCIPYLNSVGLILLKKNSHREKDRIDVSVLRQLPPEGQQSPS